SGQHLASVLQEGRENANIDAGLGSSGESRLNAHKNSGYVRHARPIAASAKSRGRATRSPDDWRRREKLSRALSSSTPTCTFPISKIASAFFAGRKIMQNMQTFCAGPDCRNEPFGTTTHGLRLAKSD